MKVLIRFVATGAGVGYFPIAQGTMGALLALILFGILPTPSPILFILTIAVLMVAGVYSASVVEQEVVSRLGPTLGRDPGIIVIDEVVGMLIALIAIPKTTKLLIFAFVLFRIFDIVKPFPAQQSERLPGGWGIMMDDIIAGIYANLMIQFGRWIF
ncbi:MAG: phosphatidylglycerophosphatase A [candidate division KSB1 bacterium]|nr:phosphatidylglycerophosphatase A [candidate division KSB1 bacterium]MDZ7335615.1 phosphatidylglycerophosphatase A [candidate division KSB1 bacterium]MDZ7357585.1 phosphatidylglycerophosphatase A [candidate division KSB1 bacterium]MDZ7399757.1 phosphatidylglycerophosphatase A [candidate division KSB1 bacterium]